MPRTKTRTFSNCCAGWRASRRWRWVTGGKGVWNNYLVDRVGAELRVGKIDLIFTIASTFLFGLDRIVMIFFGARAVMGGALSVGMLVAFLAYKDQFSQRVGKCLDTIVRLGTLTVHGERIADIALAEPEQGDISQPSDWPRRSSAPRPDSAREGSVSLQR